MARVPQYQRQVTPQLTPAPYRNVNLNEDMFGVNVSKAQGNLGNAIGNLGNALGEIKARMDDTKILGLANHSSQWEQENLYNTEKGYYYKTGKDAYGQSEQLLKDYDKYMNEYISKAGLTPSAARRANETVATLRNRIAQGVTAHDYKQGIAWSDTEAETGKTNYINTAVNMRNSPEEISKALISGYQIIEWQGEIQHKDEATVRAEKMQYRSNLHQAVLSSLLSEGSLKASEYLEEHKSEISSEKLPQYIGAVKDNELNYTARNTAQGLLGLDTASAYGFIDNIKDISERNATENEYNRLLRHQQEVQKQTDLEKSNQIMQEAYSAFDNGEDIASIMRKINVSDMSLEQKEKMYNNLKTMQELQGAGDNWADYNILLDMAAYNNEEFKNINPANWNLTHTQYDKITEMQRKAANNEYTPEVEMRKALGKVSGFNLQRPFGDGLYKRDYEDELIKFFSKVERLQGKAFDIKNPEQIQNLIEAFDYKDPDAKNKNIDETKELWLRASKHGEAYELMAKEYMYFKGENKREPNSQELYDMAKRTYNTIENNYRDRDMGKLNDAEAIYTNVNKATPKKGETKVLTYFADTAVPQMSRELGFKLTVTSRYRAGDSGSHGKGIKCDISMSELNTNQRFLAFEKVISRPDVVSIGTSDPEILKRYNKPPNPKIRDLTSYDNGYAKKHPGTTMNHKNHIDIILDTRYGGDTQGV